MPKEHPLLVKWQALYLERQLAQQHLPNHDTKHAVRSASRCTRLLRRLFLHLQRLLLPRLKSFSKLHQLGCMRSQIARNWKTPRKRRLSQVLLPLLVVQFLQRVLCHHTLHWAPTRPLNLLLRLSLKHHLLLHRPCHMDHLLLVYHLRLPMHPSEPQACSHQQILSTLLPQFMAVPLSACHQVLEHLLL